MPGRRTSPKEPDPFFRSHHQRLYGHRHLGRMVRSNADSSPWRFSLSATLPPYLYGYFGSVRDISSPEHLTGGCLKEFKEK